MPPRLLRRAVAALATVLLFGTHWIAVSASQPATPSPSLAATPGITLPPGTAKPVPCKLGMDILSIHDLNIPNDTFQADFWIWSDCPDHTFTPLTTIEFINANVRNLTKYTRTVVGGVAWESAKVRGTFRHHWNLKEFPFDRQALQIVIEDSENPATDLVFQPDVAGSTYESGLQPDGWKVRSFHLTASDRPYHTTYGDPAQPVGTSSYSHFVMSLTLERTELSSFFKLTFVVYIAFLISLISYFLNLHNPTFLTARLSVISGALFAVAVNLRTATSALSSEEGLTMVDKIHIAALVALLVDALAALITQMLVEGGRPADEINRFNRIVMALAVTGFIVANIWFIGQAVYLG